MSKKNTHDIAIKVATSEDYQNIVHIWESSVKATHDFLKPEDFEFYKSIIPQFFPNVDLYILNVENKTSAFMGVSGENLEMLFVMGELRGKGYGKHLLKYAINKLGVRKVDVNEQNKQAIEFYKRFDFRITARSEKDSMNKDYPILHMSKK